MIRTLTITLTLLAFVSTLRAQPARPNAPVFAELNFNAVQPGQQVVLAVVADIPPHYHAQSATPTEDNYIAFAVKLDESPHVTAFAPIYPKGKIIEPPALGRLDVYEGRVITYIPLEISRDAAPGELKLTGQVTLQICDDSICYPPIRPRFEVVRPIVPAGQEIQPAAAELFEGFDPASFSRLAQPVELFGVNVDIDDYALAFAGALVVGVLFNIMPCVLPIVPLKAMGFYQVAEHNRAKSMLLGAVFSAGIMATFGVLAILVVVTRTMNWGQIFGNAYFAGAIVLILILLALSMFGVFNVLLPTGVYNFTPRHDTYTGNFLFGILTAILSTPCTFGMFLGLLIWAVVQPAWIGTSLVMTVGLGMALPYFILSALPEIARKLPRSGPWNETIKQMMGFLLLASAVYFGRRFYASFITDSIFWWLMFAIIAAAGVFLVIKTLSITRRPVAIGIAAFVAALIIAPSLWATLRLTYVPIKWQPYTAEALADARAAGRPVLVKFTAAWCGNCQALEATVFVQDSVVQTVEANNVLMLKADLTDERAPGWSLLTTLNPVGAIPFTAIYLPQADEPLRLSGIYSTQDLLNALHQ